MRKFTQLIIAAAAMTGAFAASATITVDGYVNDWGVTPWGSPQTNGGNWNSSNADAQWSEDGIGSYGYVGPGYGGQNFDIEAGYSLLDGNNLYFGMVTGFDQEGEWFGGEHYGAGSLFYDFGNDGTWDLAIQMHNNGPGSAGNMYVGNTSDWWTDPNEFPGSAPYRYDGSDSSYAGNVDAFAFRDNAWSMDWKENGKYDHNVYELCFDASTWLQQIMNDGYRVHWTMECGNDILDMVVPGAVVPEPATMTLLGLGIAGLVARRRMQGKAQKA